MYKFFIFSFALIVGNLPMNRASSSSSDTFKVIFFLLEDCKITQAYTDKLQDIHGKFATDSILFTGFFPNPVSKDSTIQAFVTKYQLPFKCTRTGASKMAKRFSITVTPEVVVYNESRDSVYYQGRIDNLFERVGQRRQVVTANELEEALSCIQQNRPIAVPRTAAVGCFLKLE
jgi:hypothetical protein